MCSIRVQLRLAPCSCAELSHSITARRKAVDSWPNAARPRLGASLHQTDTLPVLDPSRGRIKRCCARPNLIQPQRFSFCEICATSCGSVVCTICSGTGTVNTEPGGAGVPFYIGEARCKLCSGQGVLPCPLCAGYEDRMPPPDPEHGSADTEDAEHDAMSVPEPDWQQGSKGDIIEGHGAGGWL